MAQERDRRVVALDTIDKIEPYGETARGAAFSAQANLAGNIAGTSAALMTDLSEQDAVAQAANITFDMDEAGNPIMPEAQGFQGGLAARNAFGAALDERYKNNVALNLEEKLSDAQNQFLYDEDGYRQAAAVIIGATGDVLSPGFEGWFADTSAKMNSNYAAKIGYRSATRAEAEARAASRSNARRGSEKTDNMSLDGAVNGILEGWASSGEPDPALIDPETGQPTPMGVDEATREATVGVSQNVASTSVGSPDAAAAVAAGSGLSVEAQERVAADQSARLSTLDSIHDKRQTKVPRSTANTNFAAALDPQAGTLNFSGMNKGDREGIAYRIDAAAQLDANFILEGHHVAPDLPNNHRFLLEAQQNSGVFFDSTVQVLNAAGAGAITDPSNYVQALTFYENSQQSANNPAGWIAGNATSAAALDEGSFYFGVRGPVATWSEQDHKDFATFTSNQQKKPVPDYSVEMAKAFEVDTKVYTNEDDRKEAITALAVADVQEILGGAGMDGTIPERAIVQRYTALVARGTMDRPTAKAHIAETLGRQLRDTDSYVSADGVETERAFFNHDVIGQFDPRTDYSAKFYLDRVAKGVLQSLGESPVVGEIRYQINSYPNGRITMTPQTQEMSVSGVLSPFRGGDGYASLDFEIDVTAVLNDAAKVHADVDAGLSSTQADLEVKRQIRAVQDKQLQIMENGQKSSWDLTPDEQMEMETLQARAAELQAQRTGYTSGVEEAMQTVIDAAILKTLGN